LRWGEIYFCVGEKFIFALGRNLFLRWREIYFFALERNFIFLRWREISLS
jgi:hypothetical protein